MKTCLIVDDSWVIRKVVRQIFEPLGFSCEDAENGKEALDACQKKMPDIIMLDWNMPVMDGMAFLRALRQDPHGQSVVVVICTTENDMKHIQEALASGANEYIMKPFDADIVRTKLAQLGLIES